MEGITKGGPVQQRAHYNGFIMAACLARLPPVSQDPLLLRDFRLHAKTAVCQDNLPKLKSSAAF